MDEGELCRRGWEVSQDGTKPSLPSLTNLRSRPSASAIQCPWAPPHHPHPIAR
ncbi:hypothetical protein ASPZODRAFT_133102 [Penicilliopsis zonata CBS 506.65]|uniref:Uncharacterized protein n=1 Tax=Penicilliopsis zonata CBS 506.65 TaxID=1073090 RepID=A0A1L9SG93_9EURO|nr:hypothetical protein ASPZODRAFT_133102 [Penicilliopsis zonata CBS 506.65]OJJ46107.1 hypothetical protein ASPZODRAFT_133102 [Penicilliopsis zonata CBS 506.65]